MFEFGEISPRVKALRNMYRTAEPTMDAERSRIVTEYYAAHPNQAPALKRAGVSSEMHVFKSGGHGYGIRYQQNYSVAGWQNLAGKWLERTVKKLRSKK